MRCACGGPFRVCERVLVIISIIEIQFATARHPEWWTILRAPTVLRARCRTVEEKTLKYLNKIKLKHTKVLHIVHNSLCLQEYLKPENVKSVNLSKFLFQSRTRMLEVKANFRNDTKNEDMSCPLNCKDEDDQKHLLECDQIDANCIIGEDVPKYEDLFGNNVVKQMKIAAMLQSRLQKRKKRIASRQK